MRICRFSTGEEPRFGVVTGEVDEFGQPADDSVVVALAGDPLYAVIKLLDEEHRLSDVRLLAPIIPRSKVVGIGKNYAAHAAEMGGDVPVEQATDVIFGYTIANDVTARDLQRSDVQFTRAKGFDSFCPVGPWIETD